MPSVAALRRVRIRVTGAVQGVGFRPFVYRLALDHAVRGWVVNDPAGVVIEAEAADDVIPLFLDALRTSAPPRASVQDVDVADIEPQHDGAFRILESVRSGDRTAAVLPDIAPCSDCIDELYDRADRRAAYPFTNCTNCGPRFSIVRALPYDRAHTTMAGFAMCDRCRGEYRHPLDRRFHAQPNACPVCGPRVALHAADGTRLDAADAITAVAAALRAGSIVAVKGIGGFHLMADACNGATLARLRARKHRPTKPLALMCASVEDARRLVDVPDDAAVLLAGPAAPIVLLKRRALRALAADQLAIDDAVAPGNPYLGVMLPSTPLHHLLLRAFDGPLVATSGNRADEPICTDETEAFTRLAGIADLFLVHDRPIERHVDDSVAAFIDGAPSLLRRARGFAPGPIPLERAAPDLLAVGPHLKSTIALARGRQVFVSQHIGDLDTGEAQAALERTADDFVRLYQASPVAIVHDLHPDYASTRFAALLAASWGVPSLGVQHHHAHHAACMAENRVEDETLGLVWDGTGYGMDRTIWGGEFLLGDAHHVRRTAHLLPFRLPGGAAAVREPRRVAAALLAAALSPDAAAAHPVLNAAFPRNQLDMLLHMNATGLSSPVTTSAGRLFDGIAALLGLCDVATFEAEAAIRLEHVSDATERGAYAVALLDDGRGPLLLDWRPLVAAAEHDRARGVSRALIAARVHNGMVQAISLIAQVVRCERVALSGGCFQNRLLAERAAEALRRRGFHVLQHRQVPAGDGGIAFGQIVIAAAQLRGH
jgi:hydrogenase maturation protein HypF